MADLRNLQSLPTELAECIFSLTPESSYHVCLTSRRLNRQCTPVLYRDIKVTSIQSVVRLLETLSRSETHGQFVRKLAVAYPPHCCIVLGGFDALLVKALRSTPFLTSLKIKDVISFSDALDSCTFPRLASLSFSYFPRPQSNVLLSRFLSRHPDLRNLSLSPHSAMLFPSWNPDYFPPTTRISLPKLLCYAGSDAWIDALLPESNIEIVSVTTWDRYDVEYEPADLSHVLDLLKESRGPITSFSANVIDWGWPLVRALAENLPMIKDLLLFNSDDDDELYFDDDDYDEFLEEFDKEVIPRWPALRSLYLASRDGVARVDRFREARYLCRWTKHCPLLRNCVFPSKVDWRRPVLGTKDENLVWFSASIGNESDIPWSILALVTGQYPLDGNTSLAPSLQQLVNIITNTFPGCEAEKDIEVLRGMILKKFPALFS